MPLKLLVMDGDPTTLKLLRVLGNALGHMVLTAEDPETAAHRAETQRFDLVFFGVGVAEPQAFAPLRTIRAAKLNLETTLVVLSPADDVRVLRMAFSEGADFVLGKPVAPNRVRSMLQAIDSPGWKGKRPSARMPLFAAVKCTSGDRHSELSALNISESGMLLRASMEAEVGQVVGLDFTIGEVGASLAVFARVVRKEEDRSVAVEFVDLAPEDRNAIQLYILGRLREPGRPKEREGIKIPRWSDG